MASQNPVAKRLIVSCDGTWQSADTGPADDPSNAVNFCRALANNRGKDQLDQIIFYQSGVGTNTLTGVQKLLSGSMGLGLEENSQEAYAFIANNYVAGDELFLLGFSRGAYTARSVAGLIGALGILSRDGMQYFKPVYNLYKKAKTTAEFTATLQSFVESNGLNDTDFRVGPDNVDIKAVACWETVGALGVPENYLSKKLGLNDKWKFLDTQLPTRVEYAFHALGLDEHRSSFTPTLWWLHPNTRWTRRADGETITPELLQSWFPGHHSEVGGGETDHKITNIALIWMIDQFRSRNLLDFDIDYVKQICSNTRNNQDPNWTKNKDPFYSDFFPTILWTLLGSKVRTPGRYPIPTGPNGVEPGSKTNEMVHFSVREKMEETALSPPSDALAGYTYDSKQRAWVSKKDKTANPTLIEASLPDTSDPNCLQAWLYSDWLQKQEARDN